MVKCVSIVAILQVEPTDVFDLHIQIGCTHFPGVGPSLPGGIVDDSVRLELRPNGQIASGMSRSSLRWCGFSYSIIMVSVG